MNSEFNFKNLVVPIVVMLAFWGLGIWGFLASGYTRPDPGYLHQLRSQRTQSVER